MKTKMIRLTLCLLLGFGFSQTAMAKDGDIEICGFIESIDQGSVTIEGTSYPLNTQTEYEDSNDQVIGIEDFVVGELIELTIRDGAVHELEKEDEANCSGSDDSDDDSDDESKDDSSEDENKDDDDKKEGSSKKDELEFCGKITDISDSSVTVAGKTFDFEVDTEFESKSGTQLTSDAFSIGDSVEVEIRDGKLHELEMDSSSGCKSSKLSSKPSGVSADKTRKRTQLKTKLIHTGEVDISGSGHVKYRSVAKKGKERDRLQMKVLIPVSAFAPESDVPNFSLVSYIRRGADIIAICEFGFDEIENGRAEYKVDIREKEGSLKVKKGSCDVDLSQPGFQVAVPSLLKGDEVVVLLSDLSSLVAGTM